MSDNESDYYSEAESGSNDSDIEEIDINKVKTPLAIVSNNIETFDDSEVDESDSDSDSDSEPSDGDNQTGGADDLEYSDEEKDEDVELDEYGEPIEKVVPSKQSKPKKNVELPTGIDDDDEDDEYDESYLQKFDSEITKSYVNDFHPECLIHNYDEIAKLTKIIKNEDNIIIDPYHRTIPFLTKYEKARVLGQRAKQIETGAKPLVKVPENIIDGYIIAELELREKKIPFIIKRPLPSGACEYWNIRDLEIVGF
jgi:DNA-directed RNA polymerase I, II, and III subunit RPABC2